MTIVLFNVGIVFVLCYSPTQHINLAVDLLNVSFVIQWSLWSQLPRKGNPIEALSEELDADGQTSCRAAADCTQTRAKRIEVDGMSIDIDSYDCAVLREALLVVQGHISR